MTDPVDPQPRRSRPSLDVPPSVLSVLGEKLGEAPRVSLREEPSHAGGAPVIAPGSDERGALPEGRGSYTILGEIARGGMGVVLRGHDTDLGRDVAMKVLNKDLAGRPEVVQRFVEEAQIGGQLQHPGIVPVYELGLMADERPYFTMKLVKGRTLATLLAERETTASDRRRLIDVFEAVCQTVAYAHSRGVIHRDLKPANVMVGAFGEVQVVDWGLAKVLARGGVEDERRAREVRAEHTVLETVRSDGTRSGTDSLVGSVMGTPSYMPPEQASGRVDRLDERADVFALGAILCEILTGAPPYPADSGSAVEMAAMGELDDALARLDACDADPELVRIARQCLVAAPAVRPRNAGVLAEAVQSWLEGQEERARKAQIEAAEARVRVAQERKARRLTLALAASIVVTLVVGGGAYVWTGRQRVQRAEEAAQRARALEAEVDGALDEARLLAARERWDGARAAHGRAEALVAAGDAGPELAERVAATGAEIEAGARDAEERLAREQDTARLLAELRAARNPLEVDPSLTVEKRDAAAFATYPAVFAAHGIDVDGTAPADLAEELSRRGLGADVALLLDSWAAVRRAADDEPGAVHLIEVAHLVDPDPLRADLREAVNNGDLEMLGTLAAGDLSELEPATIELLGTSLWRLKDYGRGFTVLRRAVNVYPGEVRLHLLLAEWLTPGDGPILTPDARRNARLALQHGWAVVALRPDEALGYFNLGIVYARLDDGQRAVPLLEQAVSLSGGSGYARLGLAYALVVARSEPERVLGIARGLLSEPGPPMRAFFATECESWAFIDMGDLDGGLAAAERATELRPGDKDAFLDWTELLAATGGLAEAERAFRRSTFLENDYAWHLATVDPQFVRDPDVAARIAAAAVDHAENNVRRSPSDWNGWNTLGVARLSAGDFAGAREAIERSIELGGGVGVSADWFTLAVCLAELGEPERAREWFERGRPELDGRIDALLDPRVRRIAERAADLLGLEMPEPPR